MRNNLKLLCLVLICFVSCSKKKDVLEIYLTKNFIESYDGVSLNKGIKDSTILNQVLKSYGNGVRMDTVNKKIIYMGHFKADKKDLDEVPFIIDSEIRGIDFENFQIYFDKSVTEKIYKSIPIWRKQNRFGKQFVLCHNGKVILNGYLIPSTSSYLSNTYQISYHQFINGDSEEVRFFINDSLNFEKNNLTKNLDLKNAFVGREIN